MNRDYSSQKNYDDIIHLPHHVSTVHPPMAMSVRAAQFSPFAALSGFEGAISETGRLTGKRRELDEDERYLLDEKLQEIGRYLSEHPGEGMEVAVTFFRPDERKDGGAYVTESGQLKKVDVYGRSLLLQDGRRIPVRDIVGISSEEESP